MSALKGQVSSRDQTVRIPCRALPSILIENSSLSALLRSEDLIGRFRSFMYESGAVAFISEYTLQEICANEAVSDRDQMLRALAVLATRLPRSKLRLAADYEHAITAEMSGEVTWPTPSAIDYLDILRDCVRHRAQIRVPDELATHANAAIDILYGQDRSVRDKLHAAAGSPPDSDIAETLRLPDCLPADYMTIEWAAKRSGGQWTPQELHADPGRFPIIHTFAQLTWRQSLANLADPQGRGDRELIGAFGTKKGSGRGNWGDNRVCAIAASVDIFVVDDKDLRRRAQFLKRQGLVSFSSCALADLLGSRPN